MILGVKCTMIVYSVMQVLVNSSDDEMITKLGSEEVWRKAQESVTFLF